MSYEEAMDWMKDDADKREDEADEIATLRRELAEARELNALASSRMGEAAALWKAAHPDEPAAIPDLGRLLAWLMERDADHSPDAGKMVATFRLITPDTVITVPCVLAVRDRYSEWDGFLPANERSVELLRSEYTHWLPIQWPEVG